MIRQLVYMDAKSSKFWNIELEGASHTVTFGRIGTNGQSSTKSFPTEEAARKDIGQNAGTFIGKRVVDYDPEKPARTDVAYRFRSDWENNEVIPNLEHFLA